MDNKTWIHTYVYNTYKKKRDNRDFGKKKRGSQLCVSLSSRLNETHTESKYIHGKKSSLLQSLLVIFVLASNRLCLLSFFFPLKKKKNATGTPLWACVFISHVYTTLFLPLLSHIVTNDLSAASLDGTQRVKRQAKKKDLCVHGLHLCGKESAAPSTQPLFCTRARRAGILIV